MNGGSEPERALRRLIDSLSPGDRLPTVRALMREHGASQGVVQAALRALERDGLIESYVGRGTFVSGGGAPLFANAAKRKRSVLLLTRNVGVNRRAILTP
ncbi:GntR family transcriptional regulator [Paracoccus seriniphilus]|uniref:Regulatory protein, gntR family n=1 Tax=Paracoccus seriniphilus TaxID=184748 RepID=A0A239PYY5_9RHOB|nr:winged helix-turn-helix domain-containing protein [Paracoccus seriniphilus]WCR15977.1 winged helix-turn-helix transcriptional regulator [Paracoccus seriniphilus]SNT75541.1 regulatory protein, gntR family [Paracoccus seriniphilus]